MGAEQLQEPPQRTPTPTQMGEPGGGAARPSMQSANPPHEAAHGSEEALAAGQPEAEPKGPTPDTECEDGLHRPSAADRASAASLANLALRADASTPGGGAAARSIGNPRGVRDPTRPSARPRGERHPTDITATTTLLMPSWSPAGMTPTRSQHRRRHASTRSRDATRRKTHPSRHHDKHTSSTITLPWGWSPLRVRGRRPRVAGRTGPRTSAAPQERVRAWKRPSTPLASLWARRHGPPLPGGGGTWTTHAWRATPATPANKGSKRRPKTWASGSPGLSQGSRSTWLSAYDGCFLRGPATSQREPAPWRTSRLAIGRGTRPPPPWTTPANGTMWPPGSWRIWEPTARMK